MDSSCTTQCLWRWQIGLGNICTIITKPEPRNQLFALLPPLQQVHLSTEKEQKAGGAKPKAVGGIDIQVRGSLVARWTANARYLLSSDQRLRGLDFKTL